MINIGNIKQDFASYGKKNSLVYYLNKSDNIRSSYFHFTYEYFKDAYYDGRMLKAHKKWYKSKTNRDIDFNNLTSFADKIQWIKIFEEDDRKKLLSDKLEAKKWASKIIGEDHVAKVFKEWDSVDDISMEGLPKDMFWKFSHGSAFNFIIKNGYLLYCGKDVSPLDYWNLYEFYFTVDYAFCSAYEMQYHSLKPVLYAEEYIKDTLSENYFGDYKFYCFNGEPILFERYFHSKKIDEVYTVDLKYQIIDKKLVKIKSIKEHPRNFDEMLSLAKSLSKGFNFVRVDLLTNNKKVYFTEMTFTPNSGLITHFPEDIDTEFAKKIEVDPQSIFI